MQSNTLLTKAPTVLGVFSLAVAGVSWSTTYWGMNLFFGSELRLLALVLSLCVQVGLYYACWIVARWTDLRFAEILAYVFYFLVLLPWSVCFSYFYLSTHFKDQERPQQYRQSYYQQAYVVQEDLNLILADARSAAHSQLSQITALKNQELDRGWTVPTAVPPSPALDIVLKRVRQAAENRSRQLGRDYKEGSGPGDRFSQFALEEQHTIGLRNQLDSALQQLQAVRITPDLSVEEQQSRLLKAKSIVPWPAVREVLEGRNVSIPLVPDASLFEPPETNQGKAVLALNELIALLSFQNMDVATVFSATLALFVDFLVLILALISTNFMHEPSPQLAMADQTVIGHQQYPSVTKIEARTRKFKRRLAALTAHREARIDAKVQKLNAIVEQRERIHVARQRAADRLASIGYIPLWRRILRRLQEV